MDVDVAAGNMWGKTRGSQQEDELGLPFAVPLEGTGNM
jgi:hypothetical protein